MFRSSCANLGPLPEVSRGTYPLFVWTAGHYLCPRSEYPLTELLTNQRPPRVTTCPFQLTPSGTVMFKPCIVWPVHFWIFFNVALWLYTRPGLSVLFPFTQLKPRQQCWLRALCIPLGWWRAPFISPLPPAWRWQELYLDKPLKHTTRHETASSKEVRRRLW